MKIETTSLTGRNWNQNIYINLIDNFVSKGYIIICTVVFWQICGFLKVQLKSKLSTYLYIDVCIYSRIKYINPNTSLPDYSITFCRALCFISENSYIPLLIDGIGCVSGHVRINMVQCLISSDTYSSRISIALLFLWLVFSDPCTECWRAVPNPQVMAFSVYCIVE